MLRVTKQRFLFPYKILTEIELMKRQICLIALVSIHLLIVAVRVKI